MQHESMHMIQHTGRLHGRDDGSSSQVMGPGQAAPGEQRGAASHVVDVGTLPRAMYLLRLLATAGRRGLGLTELAQRAQLPHPTVHRLLQQLGKEGMVSQIDSTRRYRLGRMAFELGLAAAAMYDLRDACRQPLRSLAETVGDTVYLTVRSGLEGVCEDRYEGPSPIRVITLEIGSRRPLGLGAGGLAILSFLPDDEREHVLDAVIRHLTAVGMVEASTLRHSVEECRARGYAFIRNRVTPGVSAVGVPLFNSLDRPIAAISIAAVNQRMTRTLVPQLAEMLSVKAREIRSTLLAQA